MKFRITMKDPDGAYDSIAEAAKLTPEQVARMPEFIDVQNAEEARAESLRKVAGKWLEHGEYITIEIDTDAGSAVVIERGK
jgi:hypothetical protein